MMGHHPIPEESRSHHASAFLGQVGDDPFGHFLAGVLDDNHVNVFAFGYHRRGIPNPFCPGHIFDVQKTVNSLIDFYKSTAVRKFFHGLLQVHAYRKLEVY